MSQRNIQSMRNKVRKLGWTIEQINRECCTSHDPQPHVRITVWNPDKPYRGGLLFVVADGSTEQAAWKWLLVRIRNGDLKWEGTIRNPLDPPTR